MATDANRTDTHNQPDDGSPMISIRSLRKTYGVYEALKEINMDIRKGEFFSLLGPSGCGKTTLLKIIGGFETANSGDVVINGDPMRGVPPYRRPTNMVFQSYAIFPHLNVRRNVGYGLRTKSLTKIEYDARIDDALALVKMEAFADRRPHQLSGGQRQRVALARAIVCQPKVLLLDEPLGALDKRLREEMQFELKGLQRRLGITFICVTHDQEEAMSMSDRIAVMAAGEVMQIDSPSNLYERPTTCGVADFIGTMNFLPARMVEARGGDALFELDGGILVSSTHPCAQTQTTFALRPEWMQISREKPAEGLNALQGRVLARSYLGDRSVYLVATHASPKPISVSAPQAWMASSPIGQDEQAWISWAPEAGVLLDR